MQSDISDWFPFNIPQDAWQVQDADEEIFLLYCQLQSSSATLDTDVNASGLGCVDSRMGELSVRLDVQEVPAHDAATRTRSEPSHSRASKRSKAASKKRDIHSASEEPLEIQLFQDVTGLRSRKGDTGSVLWRASVQLARLLLSQLPSSATALLPSNSLSSCRILELGSGTGLLGIVLAPLVGHYTATDLPSLIPLIRKNMEHNLSPIQHSKFTIDDIDWIQLHNTPAQSRYKVFPSRNVSDHSSSETPHERSTARKTAIQEHMSSSSVQRHIDLIIAVDCIYNPSLIAPLLGTIDYLATFSSHLTYQPEAGNDIDLRPLRLASPAVLIVLELRAADVSRDFLHAWLGLPGRWEIWSIPLLGPRFAMWVGRRRDGAK
ncbi:hypothetical protein JB92DRAFT_1472256 [Gautieria morchelliformis]|nr:hypothetical protein JB92DRAFT_1472256 [Gautieria morchelliformis]